jgi:magnesium transporter
MRSWIEEADRVALDPSLADLRAAFESGRPFWLDLRDPTDEAIDQIAEALALHPLAVEDSKQFGQRGKAALYGEVAMIVSFGIENGEPFEVHSYYTTEVLITLRRAESSTFDEMHQQGSIRQLLGGDPIHVLHALIMGLHERFRPVIDDMDDRLDVLEAGVFEGPNDDQLIQIARLNRHANVLRRTLTASRDFASRSTIIRELPGSGSDAALYAADVSDELQLIVADLNGVNERSLGLLGLHTSLTSNSQGVASRQLAAIATVFLPITFVVGFFGMNFSVLVNDLQVGWVPFLLWAIGLNVLCVAVTLSWMGRRGWR